MKELLDSLVQACGEKSPFILVVFMTKRTVTKLHEDASSVNIERMVLPPSKREHIAQTIISSKIDKTRRNRRRPVLMRESGDSYVLVRDVFNHVFTIPVP